jgi:hypothetical protein
VAQLHAIAELVFSAQVTIDTLFDHDRFQRREAKDDARSEPACQNRHDHLGWEK